MKPDHGLTLPDQEAVAGSAQASSSGAAPAQGLERGLGLGLGLGLGAVALRLGGLALVMAGYLGAASLAAILLVRVGADLLDGIDPFLAPERRPLLGMARLAQREIAVDLVRQVVLLGLVVGVAALRHGSAWRARLALDTREPNGLRARTLLALLLVWPVLHIVWVTGTAEAFGAAFGRGVHLSPALSRMAVAGWLLYAVALAPIAEEVLIRGEGFAQSRGFLAPAAAILVTAILFAAAHVSSFGLARPVSLLPLALVLGWLRWRTGRLWPCICLHGWSNLALIAYLLWPGTA